MDNLEQKVMDSTINKTDLNQVLSEKIIGNAISAYLMIFISGLFIFNKTNKNINNDFVKKHTKSALLIHLGFLITYIIFIFYNPTSGINILGIGLNIIITNIIFLGLLCLLVLGIYKAKNGLEFNLSKGISISGKTSILDIDGDGKITEKEKLTIVLSFVPFIGFLNYAKYEDNKVIQDATRLNLFVSTIITILYIYNSPDLANLFSLIYIIFITFIGVNLFARDQIIQIILPKYFSPTQIRFLLIVCFKYLKNYFNDKNFKEFSILINEENEKLKIIEDDDTKFLSDKKDLRQAKFLIYTPFINLVFIFFKNTKYSFHIINGLIITFLISILLGYSFINPINNYIYLLLVFPILFGIGSTKEKLIYKIPFIYDIFLIISKIISLLKFGAKKIDEKRKEENELILKIEENNLKV